MGKNKLPHHDNFREYTEEEITTIKKEVCEKHNCPYFRTNWKNVHHTELSRLGGKYCDYLCITGKMRKCMPDECKHWKDKNVKKRVNPKTGLYSL